jgi:tetratricopeptide (TPR) repeat protein
VLNPGNALGHLWYSFTLAHDGRFKEGIAEASRAAELDPLSVQVMVNFASVLMQNRQYEGAAEQARRALELEPNSAEARQQLGTADLYQGKFADAIREYQTALDLLGGRGRVAPNRVRLGFAYARSGRRKDALKIVEDLKSAAARGEIPPGGFAVWLAFLCGELGDKDQAFTLLDRAYKEHDFVLVGIQRNGLADSLRSDPRYPSLLKRIGLQD